MRWFKHLTDAADDEKLADILTEYGPEGYGVWWLLVEVIGKQMDSTDRCEASYSLEHWARKLYVSKKKTSSFLTVFSEKKLLSLSYDNESSTGKIIVNIPNMLKFRDEYSKKSGQGKEKGTDNDGSKKQNQKHKQKEKTKKVDPVFDKERKEFFAELWQVYPRKIGKPEALTHYLKTVTTDADLDLINNALGAYLEEIKDAEMKFVKHGSAWFKQWQNWIPEAHDAA